MTAPTDQERRARADAVIDRALHLLVAHDMAGFADLWAPEGSIEFPFAAPGFPPRIDGRAGIAEYLAHYTEIVDVREIAHQQRHETTDPDTVILEFETTGFAVQSGSPFRMRYIAVITIGDDGIVTYRDYWSPMAAAEALDAPDLRDASLSTRS